MKAAILLLLEVDYYWTIKLFERFIWKWHLGACEPFELRNCTVVILLQLKAIQSRLLQQVVILLLRANLLILWANICPEYFFDFCFLCVLFCFSDVFIY